MPDAFFHPRLRGLGRGCAALLIVFTLPFASACKTGGGSGTDGGSGDGGFEEDQPQYPESGDDPFFFSEAPPKVGFRVLITRGNYQVRQIGYKSGISRREDPAGDREQMEFFTAQLREIDFVNMELTGRIQIRLSPLSGQIEHIAYVNGETPKTWQASKYFQDDVSRFRFYAPSGGLPTRRFEVQYLWRIDKRAGLSDEENRKRAVEWLKKQTR